MIRKIFLLIAIAAGVFGGNTTAQITITNNSNATALAQVLAGTGVTITNVTKNCPNAASGTFANGNANIGINSGVLLTTGTTAAVNAASTTFASTDNANGGDANLNAIASASTQDVCVLEFDIVPQGNTLTFRYVFGSEEYDEFVCSQYNDVFGFFISGPNPGGGNYSSNNIALIPNTGLSVAINTVNVGQPGAGYTTAGCTANGGSLSYSNFYTNAASNAIAYDGRTVVLTSNIAVTPCATYRLKLAIGDAGDGVYDSGVFLEASSFVSQSVSITPSYDPGFTSAFEGCANGLFTITVPTTATTSTPLTYTITGSGTNGVDYQTLSGTALINPGSNSTTVPVIALTDNLPEGTETVTITINHPCTGLPAASATINIGDPPVDTAFAARYTACVGEVVQLTATGGITYNWSSNPPGQVSNPSSATPTTTVTTNTTYNTTITFGSCVSTQSFTINVDSISVDVLATPTGVICPGETDTLYAATDGGINPITFQWSAGVSNPTAQLVTVTPAVTTPYTVTITDANGCTASDTYTVSVSTALNISLGPDVNICPEDTPYVLSVPGGPYTSYQWSNGATTPTINVYASGNFWVTVTNGNCTYISDTIAIQVYPVNHPSLANQSVCSGTSATFNAAPGLTNILWSDNSTGTSITVSTAGTYYYSADDANGCRVHSDTATLTVNPAPFVNATASPDTICPGDSSILNSGAQAGLAYNWSNGATTSVTSTTVPGVFYLTVSDAVCVAFDTVEVFQHVSPNPTIAADTTVCAGQPATFSVVNGSFVSYTWSNGTTGTPSITVTAAGTYDVTVNDGNCDWVSNSVTLSNFPVVTASLPDTGACIGTPIDLSAAAGLTNIVWSTGANTNTITVTVAGNYSYTGQDANGCTVVSDTAQVIFTDLPEVDLTTSIDTLCPGDSALLDANSSGTVSYLWIPTGDTTGTIYVSQPGTYIVQVTEGYCALSDTVEVFQHNFPPVSIGANQTVCSGDTIVLTPTGGPYISYQWSNGATTPAITVFLSGTYDVTVDNGTCLLVSNTVNLLNFLGSNPIIPDTGACIGNDITLSVADTALLNVVWSTGSTTDTIIVGTTTQVWYTGIDSNGCVIVSDTADVTFSTPPVVNATASPDTICPGGSSLLSANATGNNLTYSWSNGATTDTTTVGQAGTYIVTVSDAGCVTLDTVEVFEHVFPPVSIGADQTVCVGDTVILTPTGGPYISYNWSNGVTTASDTILVAGTYTVTVDNGTCQLVSNTVIISNFNPTVLAGLPDTSACVGESITLTADNSVTSVVWNTTATTTSIVVTTAGQYWYTGVDANGCDVTSDTANVSFNSAPIVNATASPDTICTGGSSTLDANATGGNLTYVWQPGGANTSTITVTQGGTYIVQVSDGACSTNDTVTVVELTTQPISLGADDTVCSGTTVTLSVPGGPYVSYNWSNGATTPTITVGPGSYSVTVDNGLCLIGSDTVIIGQYPVTAAPLSDAGACLGTPVVLNTVPDVTNIVWTPGGASTPSITVTTAGDYSYTATDNNGCAVISDTATVTFTNPVALNATASPDTICPGGSSTLAANAVGNNLGYVWSPGGATTSTIIASVPGTYYVTVTDGACPGVDSVTVYQYNNSLTVTLNNDTTVCPGSSVVVAPSGGPYVSYNWNTQATTPTITVTTPGSYWVVVNDGRCNFASDTFTLSNAPVPTPLAFGDTTVCAGEPVVLTAEQGYTNIVWSNGAGTGFSVTVTTPGNYSYTATHSSGCTVTSTQVVVTHLSYPNADIVASPASICPGQTSTLDAGSENGVSYVWAPGGETTNTIQVSQTGTYYVTATRGGCSSTDSVVISVGAAPVLNLPQQASSCCGEVVLDPAPGQNYTFDWSNGSDASSITISNTGDTSVLYSVTATTADGCTATGRTNVLIKCVRINATATPDTIDSGDSTQLDVEGAKTGLVYVWSPATGLSSDTVRNPVAAPAEETTYTVIAADADGCADTSSVTVYIRLGAKVAIPNAFTPNGDGRNDGFYPVIFGDGAEVSEFRIYNRWGAQIHSSLSPWDGTFNSANQPAGTYVYYVVVKVPDETTAGATKEEKYTGSFSLIR